MPDIGKYYIIYVCCIVMTLKLSHFKQQMFISSQYMWARNLGVSGLMIFIWSLSWVCSHAICWGQSFGTEGSTFGPTHVVIGRLKVLLTSWPWSSVICHVCLSTAQVSLTWSLASLQKTVQEKGRKGEGVGDGDEDGERERTNELQNWSRIAFCNLIVDVICCHFCCILLVRILIQCGWELQKDLNTRWLGLLGAILEPAYFKYLSQHDKRYVTVIV